MEIKQILPIDVLKSIMVIPESFTAVNCEITVKPIDNKLDRRSQLIRELSEIAPDLQNIDAEDAIASEIYRKNCL